MNRIVLPMACVALVFAGGLGYSADNQKLTKSSSNQAKRGNNLYSVTWAGNQLVAVGDGGTILISPDGVSWCSAKRLLDSMHSWCSLYSATWTGNQIVAVGDEGMIIKGVRLPLQGAAVLKSPDGITWIKQQPDCTELHSVTWTGSQFVAVSNLGGKREILTSPDGEKWTLSWIGNANSLNAVIWTGSKIVAVGDTILISPDGGSWTGSSSGTANLLNSVSYIGSHFVAVGDDGTIISSADGVNWTISSFSDNWKINCLRYFDEHGAQQRTQMDYNLNSVTWTGSQFVAVGNTGLILTSPDGMKWKNSISLTSEHLHSVVWTGRQLAAVGDNGTILTSPDGIKWTGRSSSVNCTTK